jgi:hypothetical protein
MSEDRSTDSWMHEKCENIFHQLINATEYLKDHNNLDEKLLWGETLRDHLEGGIFTSYWDLTKLLARSFAYTSWKTTDRDLIIEKGEEGLKELIRIYTACDYLKEKECD